MEALTLAVNVGSSSRRYALFRGSESVMSALYERDGKGGIIATVRCGGEKAEESFAGDLDGVAELFLEVARRHGVLAEAGDVSIVGVRLVAPGALFAKTQTVDADFLARLEAAEPLDPIHIAPTRSEFASIAKTFPSARLVAVSDSAFHADKPECAARYALSKELDAKGEFMRWGYHGISCAGSVSALEEFLGTLPERLIILHLGSGASATAVRGGKSMDTSMGFSPLEGLVMSSRVGNIDAGALLSILEAGGMTPAELRDLLYRESGLKGVSGISNDMRVLLKKEDSDEGARRAIRLFVYTIQKYVGAYYAALGGLDALVFTGTIGERSAPIRRAVCEGLGALGIWLDSAQNEKAYEVTTEIGGHGGRVRDFTVADREMEEIARGARAATTT